MYTITELVRETGYSKHTIHTYSALGLIPPATGRGRYATWPGAALTILLAFRNNFHPENRKTRITHAIEHGLDPRGA